MTYLLWWTLTLLSYEAFAAEKAAEVLPSSDLVSTSLIDVSNLQLQRASSCNMKRVDISILDSSLPTPLLQLLLSSNEPIIIEDGAWTNRLAVSLSLVDYEELKQSHGDSTVILSTSNAYSHGRVSKTLQFYLESLAFANSSHIISAAADQSYYLFGENYDGIWHEIASSYTLPACDPICEEVAAETVGIGGYHSGVAFHYHGPGFAEMLKGRKQWFFFPPDMIQEIDRAFNKHNISTAIWAACVLPLLLSTSGSISSELLQPPLGCSLEQFNQLLPADSIINQEQNILKWANKLQHCILDQPGQILMFPSEWMHATLNLDDYNVFVSSFIDDQRAKILMQKA
jgi:hypothetical protein